MNLLKPETHSHPREETPASSSRFHLLERLAYGGGTLLVTVGPVLAGIDMVTWMAVFMGINAGVLIILCLAGAWRALSSPTSSSRQRR